MKSTSVGTLVLANSFLFGTFFTEVALAQITRACCLPNGTCAVREIQVCLAQGGFPDTRHATCTGVVCTGACCLPDGRCAFVIPQDCLPASGTFSGFGVECADVVCGGACCRANGSCVSSNEASCVLPNTFQGLGTACGNVDCKGACCLRDGSCEETGETGCQSDNGIFHGLTAECATTDCAGACCLPSGSCIETSQLGCVQDRSGEFLGLGATCGDVVCTGACCLANKTCFQSGPTPCGQSGGAYQGRESVCGDDCPVVMPTAFTYQGQLKRSGVPLNSPIDARFSLWLSPTGQEPSNQIGNTILHNAIEVANGLFTVDLNFGQNAFNGNARWLQIEIHDHADPPATFTTLTPRQALTPTPYSLETRGIVVLDNGNVGIGTKTPSGPLTVHASGAGFLHEDRNLQLATRSNGFSAEIGTLSNHPLFFLTGGSAGITIDASQRVGIGTTSPTTKLDVRGDIRLGASGQLQATGGQETLRIVRGIVDADGSKLAGSGFTTSHPTTGRYFVFFSPPFTETPAVTATGELSFVVLSELSASQVVVTMGDCDCSVSDERFHFIAIGPR